MSTQNPHSDYAPNAPELLSCLDTTDSPDDIDDEAEDEDEPEFDLDARPRRPPEPDSPPRGATRNLGGECPECGAPMQTRLRAQYGSTDAAKVKLQGFCLDDDCHLTLEGFSETFELVEKQV